MALLLKDIDTEWVKTQYPQMRINVIENKIEGELSFKIKNNGYKIEDSYRVRVDFNKYDSNGFPQVFELSGKIYDIARKHKTDVSNLHINPKGDFCLSIPKKKSIIDSQNFSLKDFFENHVEMFLYQMSYFNKEGKLPWGEYAHGYLGHIEYYAEGEIDFKELVHRLDKLEIMKVLLVNRQSKCLCGSAEKLRKCHPLIFRGINKMKIETNIVMVSQK